MKFKTLMIALIMAYCIAAPLQAAVTFDANSADLTQNAYIGATGFNFVGTGNGDYAGINYATAITGTTTRDYNNGVTTSPVKCSIAREYYLIKDGSLTFSVDIIYYLACDSITHDIHEIGYDIKVKNSNTDATLYHDSKSTNSSTDPFIPNTPILNQTVLWGTVTATAPQMIIHREKDNYVDLDFLLAPEQGYTKIQDNDNAANYFTVQAVTNDVAMSQLYDLEEESDDDKLCFIGVGSSAGYGLGLILSVLALGLGLRSRRS